jgi:hypothetical protein
MINEDHKFLKLFLQKITVFSLLFVIFSCSNNQVKKYKISGDKAVTASFPVKPLVIEDEEESGWGVNLRLSVTTISENDSAKIYRAVSTYEGKELGLLVSVPKVREKNKELAKGISLRFGKNITLKSTGKESDNLLQLLAKLYHQKTEPSLKFTDSIAVNYVNLKEFLENKEEKEGKPFTNASKNKLFFEDKSENDYAELYLNLNPEEHWIELAEKDEEYRPLLIKFLKR